MEMCQMSSHFLDLSENLLRIIAVELFLKKHQERVCRVCMSGLVIQPK